MTYDEAIEYFDDKSRSLWRSKRRSKAKDAVYRILDAFPDAVPAVMATVRAKTVDGYNYAYNSAKPGATGCLKCTIAGYMTGQQIEAEVTTRRYMASKDILCDVNLLEEDWWEMMMPAGYWDEDDYGFSRSDAAYAITERWLLDWMRERGKA